MKKQELKINYYEIPTTELEGNDKKLMKEAIEAMNKAYAPYSKFKVGCSIRLKNGKVLSGSNQENVSFSVTVCAERTTLMYANANYPDMPITEMAICAKPEGGELKDMISPCGVCRQTIAEAENRYGQPIKVFLIGKNKTIIFSSIKDLLPFCFNEL